MMFDDTLDSEHWFRLFRHGVMFSALFIVGAALLYWTEMEYEAGFLMFVSGAVAGMSFVCRIVAVALKEDDGE